MTETTLAGIFLVCLIRSSPHHLKLAALLGGIAHSLAHFSTIFIALEPEPGVGDQALNPTGYNHDQIKGNKEENKSDEWPGALVLRLWAVDKPREYDQEIAAEDDDRVIDQLKIVGGPQLERTYIAREHHHEARFEDDDLDLEVAAIGQGHQNNRENQPSQHEDER